MSRLAAVLLVVAAGCQPADPPIPITARAGDLAAIAAGSSVALVSLQGTGLPDGWRVVHRSGPHDLIGSLAGGGVFPPLSIPADTDELAIWLVPAQLLMSSQFAALTDNDLAGLALKVAGTGGGEQCQCNPCGRVIADQLVLEPGAECPIPDFAGGARYTRGDERWEIASESPGCALRLARDGACTR